jgi:hypothetical protein
MNKLKKWESKIIRCKLMDNELKWMKKKIKKKIKKCEKVI